MNDRKAFAKALDETLAEAVKGNLEGRRRRVIPGADGWKLASAMGRKVNRTDN